MFPVFIKCQSGLEVTAKMKYWQQFLQWLSSNVEHLIGTANTVASLLRKSIVVHSVGAGLTGLIWHCWAVKLNIVQLLKMQPLFTNTCHRPHDNDYMPSWVNMFLLVVFVLSVKDSALPHILWGDLEYLLCDFAVIMTGFSETFGLRCELDCIMNSRHFEHTTQRFSLTLKPHFDF